MGESLPSNSSDDDPHSPLERVGDGRNADVAPACDRRRAGDESTSAAADPAQPNSPSDHDTIAGNLKQRVLGSARWVLIRTLGVNALLMAQVMIVARLLETVDFGDVAIVMVVLTLCEGLSQTGIDLSLMRHRGKLAPLLDAAWSVQVVRGLALGGIVLILAAPVAHLQNSPAVFSLLCWGAWVPVIDGFRSMAVLLYTRELQQKQLTLAELGASAISLGICSLLAWWLRSPFALILNLIIFTVMKTCISYKIHAHRPRFTRQWGGLRPYVRYSVLFNIGSGMACFAEALDKLLIGRFIGRHGLGLYDRSMLLSNVVINQLPRFLASVVYPGFVTILHQPQRFRRLEHRYLATLIGLLCPSCIVLYLLSAPVVRWGLGERFVEAIPIFQILVIYAFCRGIIVGLQLLFDAVGNPQYRVISYGLQVVAIAVLLPPLADSMGIVGAALAVTVAGALNMTVILGALLRGAALPKTGRSTGPATGPATEPSLAESSTMEPSETQPPDVQSPQESSATLEPQPATTVSEKPAVETTP